MDWSKEFGVSHDGRSIYSVIEERQTNDFNRRLLIHGNVQSGKTHVSQCCTLFHVIEKNCLGVHIVRNLNMDKIQYINRLQRFTKRLNTNVRIIDTQLPFDDQERMNDPCVMIVMANDYQFQKMSKYLDQSTKNIHVTIDESDSITVRTVLKKKQAEAFNSIMTKFQHRLVETVYITATIDLHVFRYDESQVFKTSDILSLKKSDNYVGFEEIGKWNTYDFNDKVRMTHENFNFVVNILKNDMLTTPQRIVNDKKVPKLMNIHISFLIRHHEDVVESISSNMNESELSRITFLKHDTSRLEIQFFDQRPLYDLCPDQNPPKVYSKERHGGFVKHTYEKGMTTIRDLLLMLKHDTHRNHENIVFINGKSDGRGVSVNSEEKKGTIFIGWNVVILPSKTNLSNITQITGRQCGRYSEPDVVRENTKIYVTEKTKEDIFKYCSFINYFLDILSEARDKDLSVVEFIEKVFRNQGIRSFPINSALWNAQVFGNIPFQVMKNGKVVFNTTKKKYLTPINEEVYTGLVRNVINKHYNDCSNGRSCYELIFLLRQKSSITYAEASTLFQHDLPKLKRFLSCKFAKVFMYSSRAKLIMFHPQVLPYVVEFFELSIQYVNSFEKMMDEYFII